MARDRLRELQERTPVVLEMEEAQPLMESSNSVDLETYKDRVRDSFFEEVDIINYEIQKFADIVRHLQTLRKKDLLGGDVHKRERSDMEEVAKASMTVIKKKLYGLTVYCNKIPCPPAEHQLRKSQMFSLKKRFLSKLETYQKSEHMYQSDLKEALTLSYKEMNPEASCEEVESVVNSGAVQLKKEKSYEANQTCLDKVRLRYEEISKIERSILELHQLYIDMQSIVILQDQVLDRIEDNINTATENISNTNEHLDHAVVSSKNTRKMKLWMAALGVVITVLIIASLVAAFRPR